MLVPIPHRRDASQTQVIRLDIASVPVYETREIPVVSPCLPHLTSTVATLSQRELLTEKLIAVMERPKLKWRDAFDIWFLRSQGIVVDRDMMRCKLEDHHISSDQWRSTLAERSEAMLQSDATELYVSELSRFVRDESNGLLARRTAASALQQTADTLKTVADLL